MTTTVRELLEAGVPLVALTNQRNMGPAESIRFEPVGWLSAASRNPETLQVLIHAGASNNVQTDKDLALIGAVRSGNIETVRALLAYGANPSLDPNKLVVTKSRGAMTMQGQGSGSLLIYAAESGNPEMIREILRYNPK